MDTQEGVGEIGAAQAVDIASRSACRMNRGAGRVSEYFLRDDFFEGARECGYQILLRVDSAVLMTAAHKRLT